MAGDEVDVAFSIETPKGVRASITGAKFFAGDALQKPFASHEPWSVVAQIGIILQ